MVTAWEVLLKAKIVKDNNNKLNALYIKTKGRFKLNPNGSYRTIGIDSAIERCSLSEVVAENILKLVDIRNAAIHLTATPKSLPYLTFILGTASLRNYARLLRQWFSIGLNEYDFYILPLGFSYPFQTLNIADLSKEPRDIAVILREVERAQKEDRTHDQGFSLIGEINMTFVSVKKITEETDLAVSISPEVENPVFRDRLVSLIDKYPYTHTQVWDRLKSEIPGVKKVTSIC
jgi:hypothetical protein